VIGRDNVKVMSDKPRRSAAAGERHRGFESPIDANSEIGSKLKALYSSIQEEPIPEKFLDLLEKLDATERKKARL